MKIDARLTFNKARFDQETDAHLIISLTAPPPNTSVVRPKLALMVCVDVSTSMQGPKLEYAKLSIQKLIEHMKPDDYLGIVSFSTEAKIVAPLTRLDATKKIEMHQLVTKLYASGNTNFSGGMLQALDLLKNADLGSNYLHRVIMFTDGQANTGVATQGPDIIKIFQANAPAYISASAFGYGAGRGTDFDAEFLTNFAREAKGNYAHVENPDKALDAFGAELGGLTSTYATNIRLEISALAGHTIEKVISDVDVEEEITGEVGIKVPDILSEETRHLVVAVKLAKQKGPGPRAVNALAVKSYFETFDVTGKKEDKTLEAKAKIQFVRDGEDTSPSAELAAIVGMAQLVRTQIDAEAQAKKGNFKEASRMLHLQAMQFQGAGSAQLAVAAEGLSSRLGDAQLYSQNQGYLRSFARGATRGVGGTYSADVGGALADLGVQTRTGSQTAASELFTTTTAAPPPNGEAIINPRWVNSSGSGSPSIAQVFLQDPVVATPPALVVPVPHETDNAEPNKAPSSAKKSVKQSRSKSNW